MWTLRDFPDLDRDTRERLLDIIAREAVRLEHVSVEPGGELSSEEQGLNPMPVSGAEGERAAEDRA